MNGVVVRRLAAVAVLLLASAAPAIARAASATEPAPAHAIDLGSALSFGFGVSPLRPQLPAPLSGGRVSEGDRPADLDSHGTALSADLKLRWPGAEASPLEPYLAIGPALFLVEPDYAGRLLGTRVDPSLRLGARAGAGLNWRLGKDVTLFGAYEVTTAGDAGLPSLGSKPAADPGLSGYDFNYGVRIRF